LAVDASWQTGVSEHETGFLSGRRGEGMAPESGGHPDAAASRMRRVRQLAQAGEGGR
jgi:hypothetical protein